MALIPELDKPGPLRPWWMTAIVTGQHTNARLPLSHLGALPRGAIVLSLADYVVDTAANASGDPGVGTVRWNGAVQSEATEIYLSNVDSDSEDHGSKWVGLSPGGFLYLYNPRNLDVWQQWQITSVVMESGYLTLGVTWQAGTVFGDADPVAVTIQQPNPAAGMDRNVSTVVGSSGGVLTLDAAIGDYFRVVLTETVTDLVIANALPACTLTVSIIQDSAPRAIIWPSSFRWPVGHDNEISMAAGARDRLVITTDDHGATWDAALGKGHAA